MLREKVVRRACKIILGRHATARSLQSCRPPHRAGSKSGDTQHLTKASDVVRQFADPLRSIAGRHPKVNIGSYPNTAECEAVQAFRVKLQVESRDREALEAAVKDIKDSIACKAGE